MGFFSRLLNGQMIFERMETRILVGIVMFVATMILIGWVAINEGARMAAFDRQFAARSIERGAAMFSTYCSTCHGNDGRGIGGKAPGLNNPALFGHDFIPEVNGPRNALIAERTTLENEANDGENPPTDERRAEIDARVNEINTQIADLEQQALPFISQAQDAMVRGYDPYRPSRLANVRWGSSVFNYVYSTLVHGRPVSSGYWPDPMPNWAQQSGGPLRDDQLRDITNFILNWNRDFTIEDLVSVQQFAVEPCDPLACGGGGVETVGNDVAAIMEQFPSVTGDPNRGQALYNNSALPARGTVLGCTGCHTGGLQAPDLAGTWTRVLNERLPALPEYASGEEYLVNSIVRPNDYIVPTYTAGLMPNNFGERLSLQDLADIVVYLMSQDQ